MRGEFFESWYPLSELPIALGWVWFISGVLAIIAVTFEGAYRLSKKVIPTSGGTVATSLITVENYGYEFVHEGWPKYSRDSVMLKLNPEIHATPGVRVEDIELEMKGKRYNTDWKPMTETISGDIGEDVYVALPKSLKEGRYQAKIVAHINNTEWYSPDFTLEYVKPNSDKGGSQT